MSYFDRLLEKIDSADARLKLSSVVQEHPEVTRWIADPQSVERAEQYRNWASENWDDAHEMTKAEYNYSQRVADLEAQLGQGQNMTFDELNAKLDEFAASKGLMTQEAFGTALQAKETEYQNNIAAMGRIATKVPYLNQKHDKEFGEMFDPEVFLTEANKRGARDLDSFYNEFTAEKREAKRTADVERQLAEAREAGKREGLQAVASGQMPTLDSEPEISHFQRFMSNKQNGAAASAVPVDAELGRGQIARAAAQAGDLAAFTGRIQ